MKQTLAALMVLTITGCDAPENGLDRPSGVAVKSDVVRAGLFQPSLTLLGVVRPAETLGLSAPHTGTGSYSRRFAGGLRTGETVSAGEVLVTLANEEVRAALEEARLQADSAEADLVRARQSVAAGIQPQADLDHAAVEAHIARTRRDSAERRAAQLILVAPRAGRLVVRQVYAPGSLIQAGTMLGEIAVGGAPRVEAWAAATDRPRLHPGLATRYIGTGGAAVGEGRIVEVAPVVEDSGTVRVVAEVADASLMPAPGEGVELSVLLDARSDALTVPEEALVLGAGGAGVYRLEVGELGAGRLAARRVVVATGLRGGGRVEIVSGLSDGDRVAIAGVAFLSDGAAAVEATAAGTR